VGLHPAFVLHRRPYRESSLLLEVLSSTHGRLGIIAKGVFRRSRDAGAALQPFRPLQLDWSGRGELGVLTAFESDGQARLAAGNSLICGFYLNELLMRMLPRHDPHPDLFLDYGEALKALAAGGPAEVALRLFEVQLLATLGYGVTLDHDVVTGEAIAADAVYTYRAELGPSCNWPDPEAMAVRVSGRSLRALAAGRIDDPAILRDLKRLLRFLLKPHLGDKPLASRAWFGGPGGPGNGEATTDTDGD
jgi:DNA repair protein RecO (recombination protein O)